MRQRTHDNPSRALIRRSTAILAAVSCVLALAGCGASHKSSSTTGSKEHSKAVAFASCMRANGVPSFPDPAAGGSGVNLAGTGIDPQAPAFKSAREACAKFSPGGARGVQATEAQFLSALAFAKCMRTHGFPAFPDPTRFDAPPGPILVVGSGLFFRVSSSFDPNTSAAKKAMGACGAR